MIICDRCSKHLDNPWTFTYAGRLYTLCEACYHAMGMWLRSGLDSKDIPDDPKTTPR